MASSSTDKISLKVPLDAAGIKDFKPDKDVKVLAVDSKGAVQEQRVRLSGEGKGTATFSFASTPGAVRVVVGPGDATADELQALQTISVSVSARAWAGGKTLTLSPIAISAHYWWWWLIWCRAASSRFAAGSSAPTAARFPGRRSAPMT
jgi:hypothetical protein